MTVDFGKTSSDYAKHRAGFPEAFFERLAPFGVGLPGQRVLDLGTGTGTVARGLARRGCTVTGLDKSVALVDQAKQLDADGGVSIEYVIASAEETGLPAGTMDVVTACQCWHWFDRPRAAREVLRVLVPGGTLVIAHFDWLPLAGNVVEATERLIEATTHSGRLAVGRESRASTPTTSWMRGTTRAFPSTRRRRPLPRPHLPAKATPAEAVRLT